MAINLVMFTATGELGEAETLMVALKAGAEEMRNSIKKLLRSGDLKYVVSATNSLFGHRLNATLKDGQTCSSLNALCPSSALHSARTLPHFPMS